MQWALRIILLFRCVFFVVLSRLFSCARLVDVPCVSLTLDLKRCAAVFVCLCVCVRAACYLLVFVHQVRIEAG